MCVCVVRVWFFFSLLKIRLFLVLSRCSKRRRRRRRSRSHQWFLRDDQNRLNLVVSIERDWIETDNWCEWRRSGMWENEQNNWQGNRNECKDNIEQFFDLRLPNQTRQMSISPISSIIVIKRIMCALIVSLFEYTRDFDYLNESNSTERNGRKRRV